MSNKTAMLSQPMRGLTDQEIVVTRERAVNALHQLGYTVINTLFTDEWYSQDAMKNRGVKQPGLCFLAKSLENMSCCDAAYFCKGWEQARGCRIEHAAAKAYGIEIIYEAGAATDDAGVSRITLERENGIVEDLDKGCVFRFNPIPGREDRVELVMELLNMRGNELHLIVESAFHLGQRLGMFPELDDEDGCDDFED